MGREFVRKRMKLAKPQIYKQYEKTIYSLMCPYCKTVMIGGEYHSENVLCYKCTHCDKTIWLDKE